MLISKSPKNLLMLAFSIIIITILFSACQKEPETSPIPAIETVVDSIPSADGVMIHYDIRGEGETALVFVHCWSCDRSYWSEQVDEFATKFKVVTIDLAGHGQSGSNRDVWSMSAFGNDVAVVAYKLGLKKIILIGHSMGAAVMVEAARILPGRVDGLVAVDMFQALGTSFSEDQVKAFLEPFQENFEEATRNFVQPMFSPTADSALAARIIDDMSSAPPEVGVGAFEEIFKYYFTDRIVLALVELNLPVRCINADNSPINIEAGRKAAPSFDAKIMKGVGHFLHLEDPETFNRLLRETITEINSPNPE
jgi:pimeloyl-ACP methyl ester carboxylesterase